MSLTVPEAGPIAGRAAQVQVEAPQTAAVVSQFGDRMMQIGTAMEKDRLGRELGQTRNTMMAGLNDLRLQYDQVGDPEQIDRDFPRAAAELKASIFAGIDPKNRADAGQMFDELQTSHSFALGSRALDLRQSQRRATLMQTASTVVRSGATTDRQTQATYLTQYRSTLDEAVQAGAMTPEQAQANFAQVAGDTDAARMTRLMSDSPDALIAGIDAGELGTGLPGDQLQAYRARAVASKEAQASAEAVAARRAEGELVATAKVRLNDGISLLRSGNAFAGADEVAGYLKSPAVAATREAQEYRDAQMLFVTMPGYAAMSLDEKRKTLDAARRRPKDKAYDTGVITAMEASLNAHEEALKKGDIYAYSSRIDGRTPSALLDPTQANDDDLAKSFATRMVEAAGLEASGLTGTRRGQPVAAPFFTPAERDIYAPLAASTANPAERARLARVMAAQLGDRTEKAAAEIGGDTVFSFMGGMLANGAGSERLARETFEGQRIIEGKQVSLPPVTDRRTAYFTSFNALFKDGTGPGGQDQTPIRDAILAAADARYAFLAKNDPDRADGKISETLYQRALHEVMGGTGDPGSTDATGGVQTIRSASGSYPVILPPGVRKTDVEDSLARLSPAFTANPRQGIDRAATIGADVWGELSGDGSVPSVGGTLPGPTTIANARLRPVGGTTYEMIIIDERTGHELVLKTAKGANWRFDLRNLLRLGNPR